MLTRTTKVCVALILAALVAVPAAALGGPPQKCSQLAKVTAKLDMDYAEEIIDYLTSLGDSTTGLGFRGAGGGADIASAEWIALEMEKIGLVDVELEVVPVDAWEFREAWLYVPGLDWTMNAASFGGFPETGEPMAREMIWLNNGYKSDYDAYEELYGPDYFDDKIGLINWVGYDFWTDSIGVEAMLHGLEGIVLTTIKCNVGQGYDALSCHDGLGIPPEQYPDMVFPPLISISKENGTVLRNMLKEIGSMDAVMYSDIEITRMNYENPEMGGHAYNVVGTLPGRYYGTDNDEYLIFGPHHDAWFYGAMDDTSGEAAMLVIADAIMQAVGPGELDRTIIFTSHTAEEYGVLNTYYDWCWGANYQITVEHPEWVGKSVAYLCMELMGKAGEPVTMNCPPEVYSFVKQALVKNQANLPYGASVDPRAHTWADHWTFTAAGIPGIEFASTSDEWESLYYHTQGDAPCLIDYDYLRQLFIVISDMTLKLSTWSVMPFNFSSYVSQLESTVYNSSNFNVQGLDEVYAESGVDPTVNFETLLAELDEFSQKVPELQSALSLLKGAYDHDVNSDVIALAAMLDQNMTSMGVWEQDWFPYQQSILDVYHLFDGIDILTAGEVTDDAVSDAVMTLNWVGIMWYYDFMSYENYMDQRDRLSGDRVMSWGLQTHLQPTIEIWEEYDALVNLMYSEDVTWDDVAWIVENLEGHLAEALGQLENAFELMWMSLEDANAKIDSILAEL